MLENPPIDHLSKHLTENHDDEWRFEYIDYDGLAFNCYLPSDAKDLFVVIDASHYNILDVGSSIPSALIAEIETIVADGLQIYLDWDATDKPEKWAQKTLLTESDSL